MENPGLEMQDTTIDGSVSAAPVIVPSQPQAEAETVEETLIATPTTTSSNIDAASDKLRLVQDATLKFVANASNETLGACAVGLCASAYLIFGRVGLLFIGAVGGVILHATWEGQIARVGEHNERATDLNKRRKEAGVEVAARLLQWRQTKMASEDTNLEDAESVKKGLDSQQTDFSSFQSATEEALNGFTDAVIRDYVKWWYSPILPADQSFPAACRQTLTSFILSFSKHTSRKRPADMFLDFVTHASSILIIFLTELATALNASGRAEPEEAIKTYLTSQPDSNLAHVLSKQEQDHKLKLVADDVLFTFLNPQAYEFPPVRSFLQQILSELILRSTITTCSKPEWINGWIVYLLEEGEPELLNVIDAGVGAATSRSRRRESMDEEARRIERGHQRRVSKAEEAMEQAMLEAQRLNEMIAEDDARRKKDESSAIETEDVASVSTTDVEMATPTSSDSDPARYIEAPAKQTMVFDSEGNILPALVTAPVEDTKVFTSFDQLGSQPVLTALQTGPISAAASEVSLVAPLTLHNASITLLDMGLGDEKAVIRQKPADEYLVQIEPASTKHSGWMISRKYADFEPLHETLRRIAVISGAPEFANLHPVLPPWRGHTRSALLTALEKYLRDALKHDTLAESESMKKFLNKEAGLGKGPAQKKNVLTQSSQALENVGKGFVNVLGQGGKGIAGGGKAVFGGVQSAFGAVSTGVAGQGRSPSANKVPTLNSFSGAASATGSSRVSKEYAPLSPGRDSPSKMLSQAGRTNSTSVKQIPAARPTSVQFEESPLTLEETLSLPPRPSEMTEDWISTSRSEEGTPPELPPRPSVSSTRPVTPTPAPTLPSVESAPSTRPGTPSRTSSKKFAPLNEEETRVAVELMFSIITELYSLSSAWGIRLSLLMAAKGFLLRPNNPQLESIRALLQNDILDANLADSAVATHINKLRENTLPTEEELAKWPKEMTNIEKERLKNKARKLLVERGMPQALTSVMGAAASGEALGRVFDCLQNEQVAKGLIFALLLQAIRAATQ